MTAELMTARERSDLQVLARMNGRVAKSDVDAVVAERHRDFVEEITRDWSAQELQVGELLAEANAKMSELNAEIQRRCDAQGIREGLRPRMWSALVLSPRYDRDSLAEVKLKAKAELDAAGKRAKVEIDRQVAHVCAQIIGTGLTSAEATAFLDRVQSPQELVQPLDAATFGRRPRELSGGQS